METRDTFWRVGHSITGHNIEGSTSVGYRKFRAFFGTSPAVCVIVWQNLCAVMPKNAVPKQLFGALLHLKQYSFENVNATLAGASEKKFRKWSHLFIYLIGKMRVVEDK